MKTKITLLLFVIILGAILSQPALAETEVNININLPLVQVHEEPMMAVVPGTYIYFIYGHDYDFFFYGGYWWRFHNNFWYRANNYNGPWKIRKIKYVPAPLLKLPPGWRKQAAIHSNLKYKDVKQNWKQWEKEKHWEKKVEKKENQIDKAKQDKAKQDKTKQDKNNKNSGKGRK